MRCSRVWMRCSREWMRCSRVARASDSQCLSNKCPGFDPSILRHSGIRGAADEAVLNTVHTRQNKKKTFKKWFPPPWLKVIFSIFSLFCKTSFFRGIPLRSVPSFGIGSSAEFGIPRNEHFLPRNNGNRSESIPRNFFGTKFRSQPCTPKA